MKLNLGCGEDIRPGFVNLDAVARPGVTAFDLTRDKLTHSFGAACVDFVLAYDVVEHLHRWEALALFKDVFVVLRSGGQFEVRVPDCERIINDKDMALSHKLTMLYGGQDIPQGVNPAMDRIRADYPEHFCHRYGWTPASLQARLHDTGFYPVRFTREGVNFVTTANKP